MRKPNMAEFGRGRVKLFKSLRNTFLCFTVSFGALVMITREPVYNDSFFGKYFVLLHDTPNTSVVAAKKNLNEYLVTCMVHSFNLNKPSTINYHQALWFF